MKNELSYEMSYYIYQVVVWGKNFITDEYFQDILYTTCFEEKAYDELKYYVEDIESVDGTNGLEFLEVKIIKTRLESEVVNTIKTVKLQ